MNKKEIARELEALEFKAWVIRSTFLAISDAIIEGPNSSTNFEGALHGVHSQICTLQEKLKKARDDVFEVLRKEQRKDG